MLLTFVFWELIFFPSSPWLLNNGEKRKGTVCTERDRKFTRAVGKKIDIFILVSVLFRKEDISLVNQKNWIQIQYSSNISKRSDWFVTLYFQHQARLIFVKGFIKQFSTFKKSEYVLPPKDHTFLDSKYRTETLC